MYNFLKNSGSYYREVIGTEFYDNYWDVVLNDLSGSSTVFSSSTQIEYANDWMENSGSTFFNDLYLEWSAR